MMKKTISACVLLLAITVATLSAFTNQYGYSYPTIAYLDAPATQGQSISAPYLHFDGWAVDCAAAQQSRYIILYRLNANQVYEEVPATVYVMTRTDVQNVYSPYCSGLSSELGFMVYPNSTEPTGYWQYVLMIGNGTSWVQLAQEINVTN